MLFAIEVTGSLELKPLSPAIIRTLCSKADLSQQTAEVFPVFQSKLRWKQPRPKKVVPSRSWRQRFGKASKLAKTRTRFS